MFLVMTHCWSRGSIAIMGDESYMYRCSQGSFTEVRLGIMAIWNTCSRLLVIDYTKNPSFILFAF